MFRLCAVVAKDPHLVRFISIMLHFGLFPSFDSIEGMGEEIWEVVYEEFDPLGHIHMLGLDGLWTQIIYVWQKTLWEHENISLVDGIHVTVPFAFDVMIQN
ncbi:hypothetical protein ACJX0J_039776, partial [Zea mays]